MPQVVAKEVLHHRSIPSFLTVFYRIERMYFTDRERERWREIVCVCERERERDIVCVIERVKESERERR